MDSRVETAHGGNGSGIQLKARRVGLVPADFGRPDHDAQAPSGTMGTSACHPRSVDMVGITSFLGGTVDDTERETDRLWAHGLAEHADQHLVLLGEECSVEHR